MNRGFSYVELGPEFVYVRVACIGSEFFCVLSELFMSS